MLRPALLLFAGLGAAIIGRAAWGYGTDDLVASTLVAMVGLVFSVGFVEQWRRLTAQHGLASALSTLPSPATEALFQNPSPHLAGPLRAVLAGRAMPAAEQGITPYLLGVLIMLGILGTFLGLVQTMAGARMLMHDAPDTESLRAALAVPLSGLGRAFGTSVAGVGSSICLGLSAMLVRHSGTRLRARLVAYAGLELAEFSPQGRQIRLLETLVHQGSALPEAAGSLSQVTERLAHLEEALVTRQAEALERIGREASRAATVAAEAVGAAAQGVSDRFSKDLSTAMGRAEQVAGRLAGAASEGAAQAVGVHLTRLEQALKAHADSRGVAERKHLETLQEALARTLSQLTEQERRRADGLLGAIEDHRTQLNAEARRAAESEEDRMGRLRQDSQALLGRLESLAVAQREAEAELITRVGEASGAQTAVIRAQATDLAAEIRRMAEQIFQADTHRQQALQGGEQAAEARSAGLADRLAGLEGQRLARLEQSQGVLVERLTAAEAERETAWLAAIAHQNELAERQAVEARATIARLEAAAVEQAAVTRAELAEARRAWSELATSLARSEEARLARLETEFSSVLTGVVGLRDGLAEGERARAETMRNDFASLLDAVRVSETRQIASEHGRVELARAQVNAMSSAAADGVSALQAPIQVIVDRLEGVAVTLAAAERERADALNDRLDAVVGQVQAITTRLERAEQDRVAAFGAAVDRLRAAADVAAGEITERGAASTAVIERLDALVSRLAADAEGQTRRLAVGEAAGQARLAALAESLGERLAGTGTIVREAADLLRGGGAELTAVAEMFAAAVDGYREMSERSLATFARLEESLSRTDGAGIDRRMGEYLDQSREIFGDAMRFQRELFNELRALREG